MQESRSTRAFTACSLDCNWWAFALRGLAGLVFGMLVLMVPVATMLVLTVAFGSYALVEGVLNLVTGLRRAAKGRRWKWMVASGVLGLAAGITALIWLPAATLGLSYLLWGVIAAWLVTTGITEVAAALGLRGMGRGAWLLGIRGAISLLVSIGILFILAQGATASLALLGLLIGMGAVLSGVIMLTLAIRLRRLDQEGQVRAG